MKVKDIPIPEQWPILVRRAVLHVASLAHWSIIYTHSLAADSPLQRVRLAGKLERAENELALLKEELRIKDARMMKMPARNRPHYPPTERMAILELKTGRSWNLAQTAARFLVEPDTISLWLNRLDEDGEHALVRMPEPVNKFPDFVRYVVQRLKVLCPRMGKQRIADTLARAGLHLCATTVGRLLANPPASRPDHHVPSFATTSGRTVTARHPNHVWHVDLTIVPTSSGLWVPWWPWSKPTVWPFCWHVAVVIDHFSRRIMGFAIFKQSPTSLAIRRFLARTMRQCKAQPRHIISDKGKQFDCAAYRTWAKRRNIACRYGAVGKYGSISVIERLIRSLKNECTRRIMVPMNVREFRKEIEFYVLWYNQFRPHQSLQGRSPQELYARSLAAYRTGGSGTGPPAFPLQPTRNCDLPPAVPHVKHLAGRQHLPIVELRKAA